MALPDLSGMSQAQAIAALQQYYAQSGQLSPQDPYAGSGFTQDPQFSQGVQPAYGNDKISGLSPTASGGFSGALTPSFDPMTAGGQYGQYRGEFDAQGNLIPSSVQFGQDQRHNGWISENMPLVTLAAMAGPAAYSMFGPGAGSAGWVSGESLPAGAMVGTDAAGFSGAATAPTMATGVGGTGAGSGIGTSMIGEFGPGMGAGVSDIIPAAGGGGGIGSIINGLGGAKGIATGLGALAGLAGSGDKTSTSETSVPAWLQPYGQDLVQRGQDYAQQGFQNFGGQRFAGPNQAQQNAWEMVNQAANNPTAQQGQAETAYQSLLSGNTPTYANGAQVNNQYIGQTTPGASNQYIGQQTGSNVLGLAQGNVNPYLDKQTQQIGPLGQMNLAQSTTNVGKNALLGMNNPYLQNSIDASVGDITRNFNNTINPQLDRMARASGSFGNSGVEQARQEAGRTLASQIGRTSNDMRMTDYALQAQLGEGDVNRQVNTSLADATRNLGASKDMQTFNIGNDFQRQALNAGYNAGDITRNLSGYNTQQGNVLNAGMYDTTSRQNDLGRNSTLTQGMNQFNSTLGQNDLGRNTQYMGQQQLFNANQGNFDILNGLNTWNNSQNRIASTLPQWQGFAEQPYRAANAMGTVGQQMNNYAQQPLDFQFQEFMRQQADPASRLGVYGTAYNTARGGNQVNTQQTGSNPAAGLIGGAASGMGLYNLFTNQRY